MILLIVKKYFSGPFKIYFKESLQDWDWKSLCSFLIQLSAHAESPGANSPRPCPGGSNLALCHSDCGKVIFRGSLLCRCLCPLPLVLILTTPKTACLCLYSLSCIPKLRIYIDKTPLRPSFLQGELPHLSQPFVLGEVLQSLQQLKAFHWTLSTMSMPTLYWGAQNRARVASPVMNKRVGSPFSVSVNTASNVSQNPIYLPYAKGSLLAYIQLGVHQDKLLSS